jgi:CheY-like chemotaxis protein
MFEGEYRVLSASDERSFGVLKNKNIDLVVSDVMMPRWMVLN